MSEPECLIAVSWETRNLGVQSFALSELFTRSPDLDILKSSINQKTEEYEKIFIQARINKNDAKIIPLLESNGFYYVESTVIPYLNLIKARHLNEFIGNKKDFLLDKYKLENLEIISLNKRDESACDKIYKISTESFSDDRFHLDPACSKEVADGRFSYWINDLLGNAKVAFYCLKYLGGIIAFMACQQETLILAGFSKQYCEAGLGSFFWLSVLEKMREQGISQARTLISINNISALNLYSRLGFKFRGPATTFHYWSS